MPGNGERGLYPMLKGLVSARVLDEDRSGKINTYHPNPHIPEAERLAKLVNLRVKVISQAINAPKKYTRVSKAKNGFTTNKIPGYEGINFAFQLKVGEAQKITRTIEGVGKGLRNTPKPGYEMAKVWNLVPNIPMDPDELMTIISTFSGNHYLANALAPDFVNKAAGQLRERQSKPRGGRGRNNRGRGKGNRPPKRQENAPIKEEDGKREKAPKEDAA